MTKQLQLNKLSTDRKLLNNTLTEDTTLVILKNKKSEYQDISILKAIFGILAF